MTILNSTFIRNTATRQGGALHYDYVRPSLRNNLYQNNSALYGPNIASYPVRIKLVNSTEDEMLLDNVGSGIPYPHTLNLGLYDYDDQIMILDSSDQISISPVDLQSSDISGINVGLLSQGSTSFDNVAFISSPGLVNVQFKATSKAIDDDKIQNVFGNTVSNNTINVNFRFCQPGEIITNNNQCQGCSAGTYSLRWNSTECTNCIDDAV